MPRLHALELVPDAAGDAAVRRDWQVLHDAGLASQADHTGTTNTPHVTLLALPAMDAIVEARAAELVGGLLPVTVRVSGLALLGGDKVTVARLLDVPPSLVRAVLDLREEVGGERHPGWLPHVTLGRRIPRTEARRAVDVLGYDDVALTLPTLRRWDPELREVRILVP
jgi:2'-5' RNA ligase superfamily